MLRLQTFGRKVSRNGSQMQRPKRGDRDLTIFDTEERSLI
jgi:hypothetical protein